MQLQQLGYTAQTKRTIKSGLEFNKLFPVASGTNKVINKDASVNDTLEAMQQIVNNKSWQVKKLLKVLYNPNLKEFCKNIFNFCYTYINYKQDDFGVEQLREPARTWADRHKGVDCDCYSIFIGAILKEAGIPFKFRVIKLNNKPNYQHVYVVVPNSNGSEFIIDPVVDEFNTEAKGITGVKDVALNGIPLQQLSGVVNNNFMNTSVYGMGSVDPITLSLISNAAASGSSGNGSEKSALQNVLNIGALVDKLKNWASSIGNKDNTTPHPVGYIRIYDYFPGGPKFGQTPRYEPTNIGFQKHYEKQVLLPETSPGRRDGMNASAAGINDLAMAESLVITYGPRFFASTPPGDWIGFWRNLIAAYQADVAAASKTKPSSGGVNVPGNLDKPGFFNTASFGWVGFLLLLAVGYGVYNYLPTNKTTA